MRTILCSLLLAASLLTGCDTFGLSDALLSLSDASTDPAALQSDAVWVAVAAVSGGEAVEFPSEGFTASFTTHGFVTGAVVPNSYVGEYTASADGALSVSDMYMTLAGGGDERLERALLGGLGQATRFEVEGRTLQVRSDGGDGIRFERRD